MVEPGNEYYPLKVCGKNYTTNDILVGSIRGLGHILFLGSTAVVIYAGISLMYRERIIKMEMDYLRKELAETKAMQESFLNDVFQLKVNVAVNSNTLRRMGSIPPMAPTPPGGNGDGNGKKGGVEGLPKLLPSSFIPPPNQVWKMAGRALTNARRLLKR